MQPSTVVSFKGIAADTDQQFEIPAVKANEDTSLLDGKLKALKHRIGMQMLKHLV